MTSQLDQNTANAKAFYDLMFNLSRPADAIAQYVEAEYRQHNPGVGDGKRAIAQDDYVFCTATSSATAPTTTRVSTSFASTPTARSSSTGMSSGRPPTRQ
jgi:predicted SnoaL-like aldol condensation-catalyzing enzyme